MWIELPSRFGKKRLTHSWRVPTVLSQLESRDMLAGDAFSIHEVSSEPVQQVLVADLDGDRFDDVVTLSEGSVASWQRNLRAGRFSTPIPISNGNSQSFVMLAEDIDGDGDLDIAATSRRGISWFENLDGKGSFGNETVVSSEQGTTIFLNFADVDRDGDQDFLWTGLNHPRVFWLENTDGHGEFSRAHVIEESFLGGVSADGADFDGDGDTDVVIGTADQGQLIWYENLDGKGTFGPRIVVGSGFGDRVAAFDIDLDGDMDFFATSIAGRGDWFENTDGKGSFVKHTISNQLKPLNSALTDLDADGDIDIVHVQPGKIFWFENTEQDARFIERTLIEALDVPSETIDLAIGDLNADGEKDIVLVDDSTSTVSWFENSGNLASFAGVQAIRIDTNGARDIEPWDVDSDGDIDLVVAVWDGKGIVWYDNVDGRGDFTRQHRISFDSSLDISIVDVDGDAQMDFVSQSVDALNWFEQSPGGTTFQRMDVLLTDFDRFRFGDIDGDGLSDLVYQNGNKIAWRRNLNSAVRFGPDSVLANLPKGFHLQLEVGDIDGNGSQDLAFVDTGGRLFWSPNDGRGSFDGVNLISEERVSWNSLILEDLDGDGDDDVVVDPSGRLDWFESNGDGSFQDSVTLATGIPVPYEVFTNRESEGAATTEFFIATQRGIQRYSFSGSRFGEPQVVHAQARSPRSISFADFDNDGRTDFAATFSSSSFCCTPRLAWYRNRIPGDSNNDARFDSADLVLAFQAAKYEVENARTTFEEGDWNADGKFDSSDLVFVFQNGSYEVGSRPRIMNGAAIVELLFDDHDPRLTHRFGKINRGR